MHFFTITNRILSFLRSGIIYKFQVWWQQCYFYDKAKRHFKVRMCEHLGISVLAVERGKGDDVSTIKNIFYAAIARLILKISPFSLPTITTLKLPYWRVS